MGIITDGKLVEKQKQARFTIKDTELLLRIFLDAPMRGKDIEQGMSTLLKLKEVHSRLLEKESDSII